jgi:hypothetical protein
MAGWLGGLCREGSVKRAPRITAIAAASAVPQIHA